MDATNKRFIPVMCYSYLIDFEMTEMEMTITKKRTLEACDVLIVCGERKITGSMLREIRWAKEMDKEVINLYESKEDHNERKAR